MQFGVTLLARGAALDLEMPFAGAPTLVGEAQKIKRCRLVSFPLSTSSGPAAERQKLRLGGFHLQVKLCQPLFQLPQKLHGL